MNIPIFKLHFEKDFRSQFAIGCEKIFDSGILTNGAYVAEFEKQFAASCDTAHALAVNSGTSALEVVLRALDVRGKTVIIPTNTFIATAVAVENAGGKILPLDIESQTFALSPEALKENLSSNTAAVILVHIGGNISPHVREIAGMCKDHGVPLIEDACHAHGSRQEDINAGSFGTAGCFSFFPTKVMTTGEGGMVTTNDEDLFNRMFSIRQFGMNPANKDLHIRWGSNFKMTEFQALLGIIDLERLPGRIKRRNHLARIYRDRLQASCWTAVAPPPAGKSSHYKQIVLSSMDRESVYDGCKKKGISLTGEVYRYPIHRQPVYERFRRTGRFPVADTFCKGHICPPLYPELTEEEVEYICDVLRSLSPSDKQTSPIC